jgi:radical SAM superfamily enzyme YgiQ (UPF0313 family)
MESSMRPYATHPPSWVDRQLAHLENETPNDHVFVYDPIFGLGRERTLEMCRVLDKRRFSYAVESRVDVLSPDLVPVLREAGVETTYLGIESASAETLVRMNKLRSVSDTDKYLAGALAILEACFDHDVMPVIGFMLGFPGDTEADYQATLEFVKRVRRLHDRVIARTGVETGFTLFALYTKIYDGSPLAEHIEAFPETILRSEPFLGERTVLSPAPGMDLETTKWYQSEIVRHGAYTPSALDRFRSYYSFSMEDFLVEHPELTDEQGVTVLGDSLRRFLPEFSVASNFMRYDKSRN